MTIQRSSTARVGKASPRPARPKPAPEPTPTDRAFSRFPVDMGHVYATSREIDDARRAVCLMAEGGEADRDAAFTRCIRALEQGQGYLDILRSDIERGAAKDGAA